MLNALFKNAAVPTAQNAVSGTSAGEETVPAVKIEAKDAANNTGKVVTLTSKAYSHSDKGSFMLVNLGADYPNALLTVVLRGSAKALGENIDGKMVTLTGKVIDYKGRPEIEVREPAGITLK